MKITSEYLLVFLLISAIEAAIKDYYKILGVKKNASEKEIKKAFREKAKVLHPDKNQSPNAEQQFRDLAEGKYNKIEVKTEINKPFFQFTAYEILSDPQKRQSYDHGGPRNGFKFSQGTRANNFNFNFDDLFAQFEQDIFGQDMKSQHFEPHFRSHFNHHNRAASGASNDGFSFDDIFNANDGFFQDPFEGLFPEDELLSGFGHQQRHHHASRQQHCKTVTKRINNMVTTYTHCS